MWDKEKIEQALFLIVMLIMLSVGIGVFVLATYYASKG